LGYDNVVATGQFTKYCTKWRNRKTADKTWEDFRTTFTIYDKERSDSMTVEEASFSVNQIQAMVQAGIQNEMANWCLPAEEEGPPNVPPPSQGHVQPPPSANILSETDITSLRKLLAERGTKSDRTPRTYTGIAQGVDEKGHPITYCHSHGWTRNLDHNSTNCSRPLDGHKKDATLTNKMGGVDGQIKFRKRENKK